MTSLQIRAGSRPGWTSTSKAAKRLIDLVSGLGGLIFLSPVMLLIAVLMRLESKGPIFVRETRIGLGGNEFLARRFRIERDGRFAVSDPLSFEPEMTRTGEFLAITGLEFLPLIFNLIWGEISLIGPIALPPHLAQIIAREDPASYAIRNSVSPGLMGPWQLLRRLGYDLPLMVQVDLDYITHWSLLLDLSILARTFLALIIR